MAFDPRLLKRWEYTLLLGFSVFSMLGYFILIFSLADFTNSVGKNSSQASVASALFNIGQAIGRPLIGYFSDKTGHINMAGSMTFLAGVLPLVIWTNTKSYGELIFFAIVEGLVAENFWATIAPLVAEVVGLENVPCGLNLIWLVIAVPCTFSQPIALVIFTGTGNYLGTQLFRGFMYITTAACMLVLRGWKIAHITQSATGTESCERSVATADANAGDKGQAIKITVGVHRFNYLRWANV